MPIQIKTGEPGKSLVLCVKLKGENIGEPEIFIWNSYTSEVYEDTKSPLKIKYLWESWLVR